MMMSCLSPFAVIFGISMRFIRPIFRNSLSATGLSAVFVSASMIDYELETGRNLLKEEMMQLSEIYSDYMNLNSNIKRMDSLMVASRCRRMSRLEIIYFSTANAVRLIHRLGRNECVILVPSYYAEKIYKISTR